jgi:hypothetical protein
MIAGIFLDLKNLADHGGFNGCGQNGTSFVRDLAEPRARSYDLSRSSVPFRRLSLILSMRGAIFCRKIGSIGIQQRRS